MSGAPFNMLAVHLWREWRTHRRAVLALALVLPVLCAVMRLLQGEHPWPAEWLTVFAVAPALLVGSDLFTSERRNGGGSFLHRTPSGLGAAYLAKLLFFVALIASAALYGEALGRVFFMERGQRSATKLFGASGGELVFSLGFCSLWIFAASTWVRSSVLSIPVAAVFVGAMLVPVIYVLVGGERLPHTVEQNGLGLLLTLLLVAPCFVGWQAFARGRRSGRRAGRAVASSVALGIVFFVPSWAWAAQLKGESVSEVWTIDALYLGADQRHAFVNLGRAWKHARPSRPSGGWALLLNVETGELIPAGNASGSSWQAAKPYYSPEFAPRRGYSAVAFHGRYDSAYGGPSWDEAEFQTCIKQLQLQTADVHLTGDLPTAPTLFDAWDWPAELDPNSLGLSYLCRVGLGFARKSNRHPNEPSCFWDPARRRVLEDSELATLLGVEQLRSVYILPAGWLVQSERAWHLLDPVSGVVREPEILQLEDRVVGVLDDGSVLAKRNHGGLRRVDFQTDVASTVHVKPDALDAPGILEFGLARGAPMLSDRPSLIGVSANNAGTQNELNARLALFDPATDQFRVLPEPAGSERDSAPLIREEGKDFYIVQRGSSQLFRIDRDSGESTLILDLKEMQP